MTQLVMKPQILVCKAESSTDVLTSRKFAALEHVYLFVFNSKLLNLILIVSSVELQKHCSEDFDASANH